MLPMTMLQKGWLIGANRMLNVMELNMTKIRYIVDDCLKFVQREQRRGKNMMA
ncbi:MAG: hypothetical protein IPK11_05935 [Ignavibacteria bacterium]|nr:hypothetical protein [Ignavibacteria bacterium]